MYISSQQIFKKISIPHVKRNFFCIMESFCSHAGFYSMDRILLKLEDINPFVGPIIPMFLTSCCVCPGCQNQDENSSHTICGFPHLYVLSPACDAFLVTFNVQHGKRSLFSFTFSSRGRKLAVGF